MCIHNVSPEKPKVNGFGYKVFQIEFDGLHSAFMGTLNPWKEWIKAEAIYDDQPGFHIYATREKAEECVR